MITSQLNQPIEQSKFIGEKQMANGNGGFKFSKKMTMATGGVAGILMALQWFQDFFINCPTALYVALPCITLVACVHIFTQGQVDKNKS